MTITIALFPAHAGVIPLSAILWMPLLTFPRTRGGDPQHRARYRRSSSFSPHTRG